MGLNVESFVGDTNYENEITCPWCGYVQSDSWEACDEDDHICDNCGNEYSHVRYVDVTYSTQKKGLYEKHEQEL